MVPIIFNFSFKTVSLIHSLDYNVLVFKYLGFFSGYLLLISNDQSRYNVIHYFKFVWKSFMVQKASCELM